MYVCIRMHLLMSYFALSNRHGNESVGLIVLSAGLYVIYFKSRYFIYIYIYLNILACVLFCFLLWAFISVFSSVGVDETTKTQKQVKVLNNRVDLCSSEPHLNEFLASVCYSFIWSLSLVPSYSFPCCRSPASQALLGKPQRDPVYGGL